MHLSESALLLVPVIALLALFAGFTVALRLRSAESVIGDLGFVYQFWFVIAYTAVPIIALVITGIDQNPFMAALLPDYGQLQLHLWRHCLFALAFVIAYLPLRKMRAPRFRVVIPPAAPLIIVVAALAILVSIVLLAILSAPVETYYDSYIRYDHLSWGLKKLTSVLVRLRQGLCAVLLTWLFLRYRRYRFIIPFIVLLLAGFEIWYSKGARILALIVLIQAGILYHLLVKRISWRALAVVALVLVLMFSLIEAVRMLGTDLNTVTNVIEEGAIGVPLEFVSVLYSGFHLYSERLAGAMPPHEWPMFFHDFISLFTFGDFTRWNPMFWYADYYFPGAGHAPITLGPIAESAIWGGEIDLFLRGIVNGLFFAWIVRWYTKHRTRWWAITVYVYCYATAMLALKYSVFVHLQLVLKNLLPAILLVQLAGFVADQRGVPRSSAIDRLRQ